MKLSIFFLRWLPEFTRWIFTRLVSAFLIFRIAGAFFSLPFDTEVPREADEAISQLFSLPSTPGYKGLVTLLSVLMGITFLAYLFGEGKSRRLHRLAQYRGRVAKLCIFVLGPIVTVLAIAFAATIKAPEGTELPSLGVWIYIAFVYLLVFAALNALEHQSKIPSGMVVFAIWLSRDANAYRLKKQAQQLSDKFTGVGSPTLDTLTHDSFALLSIPITLHSEAWTDQQQAGFSEAIIALENEWLSAGLAFKRLESATVTRRRLYASNL